MKIVTSEDFKEVEATTENLVKGLCKPIFMIETHYAQYKAHDLNTVMNLWRKSGDDSGVKNVNRLG